MPLQVMNIQASQSEHQDAVGVTHAQQVFWRGQFRQEWENEVWKRGKVLVQILQPKLREPRCPRSLCCYV